MSKIVDTLVTIGIIILLLVLAYGVVGCSYSAYVGQECLKAGYPEAATTVDFKAFCISWIDATKVVIPLEEIK